MDETNSIMNNHIRDAFLFFGLGLAVTSTLAKPTGLLLTLLNLAGLISLGACIILAFIYLIIGIMEYSSKNK